MKTLILYASNHGCTEKAVNILKTKIIDGVRIVNLKREKIDDISGYDSIIIGGSIYAGKIQDKIKQFCEQNLQLLLSKKIGLFICCYDSSRADEQLKAVFDEKLHDHALARGYFGYELNYQDMNFFEKTIMKIITKKKKNESNILIENIEKFTEKLSI